MSKFRTRSFRSLKRKTITKLRPKLIETVSVPADLVNRVSQFLDSLARLEVEHAELQVSVTLPANKQSLWAAARARLEKLRPVVTEPVQLVIRTFAALEIRLNDEPVRLPFARCGELIVWLALHGSATREQIVNALWDGSRSPSHLEYFRVVVRRTRAALSAAGQLNFNPLVFQDGRYRLSAQFEISTDVAALEAVAQPASADQLQAALEVYRGEFLPAVTSEWAALRRTKLLDTALEIALRLAETLERDNPQAALSVYHRAVQLEPLLEVAHRGIVRLLERLGAWSAAVMARAAYGKALRFES